MPLRTPRSTPEQINGILFIVKQSISNGKFRFLESRFKNMKTLARLGFVTQNVYDIIFELSFENYLNGPVDDRDISEDIDTIWEFGYDLDKDPIYIKIKVKDLDDVIGISFHIAEKPFVFHYKGIAY